LKDLLGEDLDSYVDLGRGEKSLQGGEPPPLKESGGVDYYPRGNFGSLKLFIRKTEQNPWKGSPFAKD